MFPFLQVCDSKEACLMGVSGIHWT